MAVLIPVAHLDAEDGKPLVWVCSECNTAYAPRRADYTVADLHKINRKFHQHFMLAHPYSENRVMPLIRC